MRSNGKQEKEQFDLMTDDMTTKAFHTIYIHLTAVLIMMSGCCTSLYAKDKTNILDYTEQRPLRIVSDWNLAPYEYYSMNGEPDGYNIEVLETILDKLDIPHVFMLKKWEQAVKLFDNGEADLIIEPFNNRYKYKNTTFRGRKTLSTYKIKIIYRRGTKPVTRLKDIDKNSKVALKKYDYSTFIALERNDINNSQLIFKTPKEALQGVNNGTYQYFIWGERPATKMIKGLNLNKLAMSDIDIQGGDMRFVSHNKPPTAEPDEQFARMEQSGQINNIHNKWFYPERLQNDASPTSLFIIAIITVCIIAITITNRMIKARIKENMQNILEKNKIMQEALNMSDGYVVRLDIIHPMVYNIHGNHLPPSGITAQEYQDRIHPDDRKAMWQYTENIINRKYRGDGMKYRYNTGTKENPIWRIMYNQSTVEINKNGKVTNIISTLSDITEKQENEQKSRELADKYNKIFEMSIIGMALYDKHGHLISTNKRMRSLMKFENNNDEFYRNKNLFGFTHIHNCISPENIEDVNCCARINIPERGVLEYAEMFIRPTRNQKQELVYILLTMRSISEERNIYLQRSENNKKIRTLYMKIAKAEEELRYLLNESDMKVWHSSFANREITFFKDPRNYEKKISFDDFVEHVIDENDKPLVRNFIELLHNDITPKTRELNMRDLFSDNGQRRCYSVNRIPEYDDKGNVTGYFGLIRDITDIIQAQDKLREETRKANESEQQKSIFLANMSHEIRTPLNAIVGFCDLLSTIDSPDERKEFIRIIHNNCNMLLHLINDILMVSTMDSAGLTIERRDIDFAGSFDEVCSTLAQQVAEKGLEFIKENPCTSLWAKMDFDRTQQVIINFITNAIKHTSQGHIRLGYRPENGGIRIYCEDTGSGIPKEKCEDVFKRFVKLNDFVQGTGLGLSICKAIADGYGGDIGVKSDTGQGATFWIWIPCETSKLVYKE